MTKKFKLAISNTVIVPVQGNLADASGKPAPFKFSLVCTRLDADEFKERMTSGATAHDVMGEVTTDWKGQRLVLNEDDSPAEFSAEAFAELMKIGSMGILCFNAYCREAGAQAKN